MGHVSREHQSTINGRTKDLLAPACEWQAFSGLLGSYFPQEPLPTANSDTKHRTCSGIGGKQVSTCCSAHNNFIHGVSLYCTSPIATGRQRYVSRPMAPDTHRHVFRAHGYRAPSTRKFLGEQETLHKLVSHTRLSIVRKRAGSRCPVSSRRHHPFSAKTTRS